MPKMRLPIRNTVTRVAVLTNQSIPDCDSSLRPDIIVICERSKTVTIIDITVPFESSYSAFEDARKRKKDKYSPIENHFESKGYKTFNEAHVIGSLGNYDLGNEICLQRLRISRKYAMMMKRLMISDSIRWSRNIYIDTTKLAFDNMVIPESFQQPYPNKDLQE